MDVKMRSVVFEPSSPISILLYLHNFKTACNCNEIQESAAMWLIQHFMEGPAKVALAHRRPAIENDGPQTEERLTTYCQVVDDLLGTTKTVHVIPEAKAKMTNLK